MAAGDIRTAYRASSNLTVTNLAGLGSSTTYLAGWTSGTIDNTTNLDLDILVSGSFTVESSGLSAGEIRVYAYTMLDDSTWPDLFSAGTEGTEGAATIHDMEIRDSGFVMLWGSGTDTTASRVYVMPQTSVASRLGALPPKFALYVSQSTGAALETSGQQLTIKGVAASVAQS